MLLLFALKEALEIAAIGCYFSFANYYLKIATGIHVRGHTCPSAYMSVGIHVRGHTCPWACGRKVFVTIQSTYLYEFYNQAMTGPCTAVRGEYGHNMSGDRQYFRLGYNS